MSAPYTRLGRITKAHGTKGEVTVALRDGLSCSHLDGLEVWVVPPPDSGAASRRLFGARPASRGVLLGISGAESAADALDLVGRWLLARASEVPPEVDEEDFTGYTVTDAVRGPIGAVTALIVTGANDVLVVDGGPFGEVLVPVIDDVVLEVDDALRLIKVALLDGLIEDDA